MRRRFVLLIALFFGVVVLLYLSRSQGVPTRGGDVGHVDPGGPVASEAARPAGPLRYVPLSKLLRESKAPGALFWGHVLDEDGTPLTAARISIFRSRDAGGDIDDVVAETLSGPDGSFEIPLQFPLEAAVSVTKPGYCELEDYLSLKQAGTPRHDYVLPRAQASVQGEVVTSSGNPIPGAMVFVSFPRIFTPGQDKTGLAPRIAFTGSNGRLSIEALPAGTITMAASGRGYLSSESKTLTLAPSEGGSVRFVLQQAEMVSLQIRDPNGSPISSARAELTEGLVSSDQDGTVEVPVGRDAKRLEVTIRADGYLPRTLEVEVGRQPAEVVLLPGAVVGGQVFDERGPLAGATVAVFSSDSGRERWEKTASTDGSGRFSIRISAQKISKIVVSHPGRVPTVKTAADEPLLEDLTIVLKPSEAGIFGRVFNDRGMPVKAFVVCLEGVSDGNRGFQLVKAFLDPDGRFSLTDLPSGFFNLQVVDRVTGRRKDIENLRLSSGLAYGEIQVLLTESGSPGSIPPSPQS